jgi:hypothetical protein
VDAAEDKILADLAHNAAALQSLMYTSGPKGKRQVEELCKDTDTGTDTDTNTGTPNFVGSVADEVCKKQTLCHGRPVLARNLCQARAQAGEVTYLTAFS